MKCCGEHRVTAFCPDCGSPVNSSPLLQIIAYIQGKLKSAESVKKRNDEWDIEHPDKQEFWKVRKRETHLRKIEKYKTWIKALNKLKV